MDEIITQNDRFPWKDDGFRYYPYGYYLKRRFGERVQKVSIDAGFSCPNVDGTVAIGGCVFCDNRSFSPSRRVRRDRIQAQIDDGISRLKKRYKVAKFMAYFQPATNTYAPVEELRPLFEQAISHPDVVALAIGTRPDCVPDEVLDLIEELSKQIYVSVEYGMQTVHDRSLDWMNRGHHHDAFVDAMERSRGRGFEICAHVMLGLPGESKTDMLQSAKEIAIQEVDSVKIHNL
ncbi:MAG: TIGR01212 family radical SAM protein [Planctomycetota bacterium]|nr:TIGR01212 family radical SAM protein [Planctomycetota bacterium]